MDPTLGCLGRLQVGCTPLDFIVVYGIADGIFGKVGRSSNGWLTLNALLKKWLWSAALTGTNSGAATSTAPGMRVGFVEFDGTSTAIVSNSSWSAKGTVSGNLEELLDDVDYHAEQYSKPGTIKLQTSNSNSRKVRGNTSHNGKILNFYETF